MELFHIRYISFQSQAQCLYCCIWLIFNPGDIIKIQTNPAIFTEFPCLREKDSVKTFTPSKMLLRKCEEKS